MSARLSFTVCVRPWPTRGSEPTRPRHLTALPAARPLHNVSIQPRPDKIRRHRTFQTECDGVWGYTWSTRPQGQDMQQEEAHFVMQGIMNVAIPARLLINIRREEGPV